MDSVAGAAPSLVSEQAWEEVHHRSFVAGVPVVAHIYSGVVLSGDSDTCHHIPVFDLTVDASLDRTSKAAVMEDYGEEVQSEVHS